MSALHDLAEDYVMGLLDVAETDAVAARLAAPDAPEDRALAIAVGAARDRFLPLDLAAPEAPLAPGAWDRLAAALPPQQPALPPQQPRARGAGAARWGPAGHGSGRWRLAALTAIAATTLLGVALAWRVLILEVPAVLAVLLDDGGQAVAVVEAFDDDSIRVTPLVDLEAAPAQVLQIWTKPDPDGSPVSLGLLQSLRRTTVTGPDLPDPTQDQLYEITIEPEGGSPTGLPTGPIVGKGFARVPR